MSKAKVKLWGTFIGAVSWDSEKEFAYFEYDKSFSESGIEISPFKMPLSKEIFSFPTLNKNTFKGLSGLLSDTLPDKFGNALIDSWLIRTGRTIESFNPIDRLCYIGNRGMGALEFSPAIGNISKKSEELALEDLVSLASEILEKRQDLKTSFNPEKREESMKDILQVGTSAGGARAKAVIAWNSKTNEVRSGQVKAEQGFSYWLLKFDGVKANKDKELDDPQGYGLIEYAYHKMALKAGITMEECRIFEENDRHHFMTKRFDRTEKGEKIHMQSLCALQHFDFNLGGAYSYEQTLQTIKNLGLPMSSLEEQFRRMVFNIMGRNQDDHTKNIAFLMDKSGQWSLSPAYDVMYSYNPNGAHTSRHQMTLNGKREHFALDDFKDCANNASINKSKASEIVEQVREAILEWPQYASEAGISEKKIHSINKVLRKFNK